MDGEKITNEEQQQFYFGRLKDHESLNDEEGKQKVSFLDKATSRVDERETTKSGVQRLVEASRGTTRSWTTQIRSA